MCGREHGREDDQRFTPDVENGIGSTVDQKIFETVYRGRQGDFHHMAYMRMAKVLLTLRVLDRAGISLNGKSVFDYGFGAGTFFRYCPKNARLFGVETDQENVRQVRAMLDRRGQQADLQPIDVTQWQNHPLIGRKYDVFICSHVLEHLDDPISFLTSIVPCLGKGGIFVGLVPLNERVANPHHVHAPDRQMIETWLRSAGLEVVSYEENDPFVYRLQGFFTADTGVSHVIARLISFGLGVPATMAGQRAWFAVGKLFAALTGSKPTQAAFVCRSFISNHYK